LSNLGAALYAWFKRDGNLSVLEEGIAAFREALATAPPDHPDRPLFLSNLSAALGQTARRK
jgi:hypothetical protein